MYHPFRRIPATEENYQLAKHEMRHISRGEDSCDGNEGEQHQLVLRIDDACAGEVLSFYNPSSSSRTVSTSRNINSSRRKGPVLI